MFSQPGKITLLTLASYTNCRNEILVLSKLEYELKERVANLLSLIYAFDLSMLQHNSATVKKSLSSSSRAHVLVPRQILMITTRYLEKRDELISPEKRKEQKLGTRVYKETLSYTAYFANTGHFLVKMVWEVTSEFSIFRGKLPMKASFFLIKDVFTLQAFLYIS